MQGNGDRLKPVAAGGGSGERLGSTSRAARSRCTPVRSRPRRRRGARRRSRSPCGPTSRRAGRCSRLGSITVSLPQTAAPWAAVAARPDRPAPREQAADDAPAGAVAPVDEVAEARLRDGRPRSPRCRAPCGRRRPGRSRTRGRAPWPRPSTRPSSQRCRREPATMPRPIERREGVDVHASASSSCRVELLGSEPLDQVVADAQGVRHRGQRRVDGAPTTGRSSCRRRRGCRDRGPCSSGRARRSPGRRRTGRCRSCGRSRRPGSAGRAPTSAGSPAPGSRSSPSSPLSLSSRRRCGSRLRYVFASRIVPWRSTVTRFSGWGRSSVVSQKSIACLRHVVEREARARTTGAPARRMSLSDLPSIWMWPSGRSESASAPVEVVEPERLLELRRVRLLREGDHGRVDVRHVVAADLARTSSRARRDGGRSPSGAAAPPS